MKFSFSLILTDLIKNNFMYVISFLTQADTEVFYFSPLFGLPVSSISYR